MDEDDGERNVNVDVDGAEVGDGDGDDNGYHGNHVADHDDMPIMMVMMVHLDAPRVLD